MFDLILAADWSAAAKPTGPRPKKDAIWVCADLDGVQETRYFPTRAAALDWIDGWLALGHRTLLGFDFAMGYPPGFAEALTGRAEALAVWDWLGAQLTDGPDNSNDRFAVAQEINRRFPGIGPFWGRPAALDLLDLPPKDRTREEHGLPERRAVEAVVPGAKPVWQLAYAGAVGSQSLVGLAALSKLRARWGDEMEVWPQQTGWRVPAARIALAEIYPSLWPPAAAPIKDQGQVIATARALRAADAGWFTGPAAQPDAGRIAREEGWILGVHLAASCQAMPAGVHWTPMGEALETLRATHPCCVGVETVPLSRAARRVLAEDVTARRAHPPRANAAVDGWGFAHASLPPGPIPVAPGRAAAATTRAAAVPPGHAIRILTGAALPSGVDTVALQEEAELRDGALHLRAVPRPGANAREAGEDVTEGATVLSAGRVLTPGDLALAAAAGLGDLPVRAPLRVGVLSTGDELIPPGAPGEGTPDANRPMLMAMLAGWGLAPVDLGHVADDPDALRAVLSAAPCDAILTSGGASAGDEDHLSRLLSREGCVHHWRIAIKPGRPLMLGEWQGRALFGLPGNPVAAFTCAALFARPALLQMAGSGWSVPSPQPVPAAFAKRKKPGRTEIYRARLRDGRAEVFASEGSGRTSGLSWAEGFVILPDAASEIAEGDPVPYLSFAALGLG
ncbi:molybdopterin-binding protein [Jannaschia seohaensis]|uniref:Molybdopterin molybdenumtransferase n=1 Tax=Jannaschia seohaensis TaxID=475081 RepID=A0A2Y9A212_9RHOB|nr:molybdopterin-binding protein [Jannaschia seohaensis]PWJ22017.1 molybdopterin molybdotransferase [Jannaschia seohaensis]SSA38295.1 molybdopterin molybdotransferase [Jannaschia seohaensis]